jgi:hypothetical protein
MTLRPSRPHATKRWLGLLLVVGAMSALALNAVIGHSGINSIPGSFFRVEDQQGANDVQGQVDLTQMGRDDSNATTYRLFWSWDSTDSWTGTGQTGDACALFDTNGNGFIDNVTCIRVNNPGAVAGVVKIVPNGSVGPIYLFSCSDKKIDRCTNPVPTTYTASQASAGRIGDSPLNPLADLVTDTDPFPLVGANTPHDSTVEINVLKSKIGTTPVLVNVCSYPSAGNGGNNNPFDCIVTPGTGFLKITKVAGADTTTNFSFAISPAPEPPDSASQTITGSGSTTELVMLIGSTYSVTETVPTGWTLASASCSIAGGGSTGTGTNPVTAITVSSGKVTTCTFTNNPVAPSLTLNKVVTNNNGGSAAESLWNLTATGTGATPSNLSGAGAAGSADVVSGSTFKADTYTLAESGTVSGYTNGTTYSCVKTPAGGVAGSPVSSNTITLANGDSAVCTITNDDDKARPTGSTVQSWVVHDSLGISGIRHGASNEGDATVTFSLWDNCDMQTGVASDQVGVDEVIDLSGASAETVDGVAVEVSGTYYWTVTYSGDDFNFGFTTDCRDEVTQILAKDAYPPSGRNDFPVFP